MGRIIQRLLRFGPAQIFSSPGMEKRAHTARIPMAGLPRKPREVFFGVSGALLPASSMASLASLLESANDM